jgi:hypothetical protein
VAGSNPVEREMEGNEKETGKKKQEQSDSVSRILRDGTNPHIGGIFSREPLRSRRSPSKQSRERIRSRSYPTKHTVGKWKAQPLPAHYNNLGLKKLLSPTK